MLVHCGCIWNTCVRFEGCLFAVDVYGRLVQSLRDVCSLWICIWKTCVRFEGFLFTVDVYGRVV